MGVGSEGVGDVGATADLREGAGYKARRLPNCRRRRFCREQSSVAEKSPHSSPIALGTGIYRG